MNSKKMRMSYLITAILFIVSGIILITWPQTTLDIICYGLGALILIYGAFQIYTYVKGRAEKLGYHMNLISGLIACGIGLFMLLKSEIVISILPFIVGFTLLLDSLLKFKHAYDLKKVHYEGFKWIFVLGSFTLLLACLLMYNPFDAATSMVMFMGICLVVDGLAECWTLFCVNKYMKLLDHEDIKPSDEEHQETQSKEESAKFVDITVDKEHNSSQNL